MKLLLTIILGLSSSLALATYNNSDDDGLIDREKNDSRATRKAKENSEDFVKNTKESWRNAKSKTCEVFNSKMECIKKRAEYKTQNLKDEMKDKSNDMETELEE